MSCRQLMATDPRSAGSDDAHERTHPQRGRVAHRVSDRSQGQRNASLPEVRDQVVGTAMPFGARCLMKPSWVRRKLKSASFTLGISSIGINFIYMRRMDDAAWARTQSMNSLSRYARWRTFDTRQHSGDRIFLLAGPRNW